MYVFRQPQIFVKIVKTEEPRLKTSIFIRAITVFHCPFKTETFSSRLRTTPAKTLCAFVRGGAAALLRSLLLIPEGVKPSVRVREIPSSLVSHPLSSQGVIDTNRARNDSSIVNFDVHTVSSLFSVKKKKKKLFTSDHVKSSPAQCAVILTTFWRHGTIPQCQHFRHRTSECGAVEIFVSIPVDQDS